MNKLEENKQSVVLGYERLSSELTALQVQLFSEKVEGMGLEVDLKEATICLEQLSEENIFLNSSLDVNKAKLEEISNKHSQLLSNQRETENQAFRAAKGPPLKLPEQEVFDDSLEFVSLKKRLEQVEKILKKLENAIDGVHFHSASFRRSSGKVPVPVVSKLIQAFDFKVDHDERDSEERDSTEIQPSSDPFILTKGQIENFRALLKQLSLDVENADALYKGERDGRRSDNSLHKELEYRFEALKKHNYNLEASNIELSVQYEAVKQHMTHNQEQKSELENHYEALKKDNVRLKMESNELLEKLRDCESKISKLHIKMCDVQQNSHEMASMIGCKLENLEKEATEREMLHEQAWNTTVSQIVDTVVELDESIGDFFASPVSTGPYDGLNVNSCVAASVSAATKVIVVLQKELEATSSDRKAICALCSEAKENFADLLGKNELAIGILHMIYGDLRKLVISWCRPLHEEEVGLQSDNLSDLLNFSSYEILMKQLENLLIEKLELESVNNELKSELLHKTEELEELNKMCFDLNGVCKLIEDIQGILKVEDTKIDINGTPLLHLESLVSVLVQKYREADV
ncbi:centromere-associated protein E isoform X2 [Quillaja saponaria]|uniref:Centromere-associated protein E isoform X2 n=1 Tax=Quillaja saponaria TaxID=32244 RepID=A0AAD7LXA2_QUISA|nr:centromere-associated protein E isoform X2 [Quillaja saponaria]